jgi:hypothetical protein
MSAGYQLGSTLKGRLGWEVRAMTLGGIITLNLLMSQTDDQMLSRPRLTKKQKWYILFRSMISKNYVKHVEQLLSI